MYRRLLRAGGGECPCDRCQAGSIVNISSSRDRMSQPQSESYTAAKGGIAALTHALASGLVMGALAARQGWNGLWRFAWSHDRAGGRAIRKSRRNLRKNGKSDVAKTGSKTPPNSEVKRRQNRKHCIPEGGVVA